MSHLAHIKEQTAGEPVRVQRCVREAGSGGAGRARGWVQTAARVLCSPPWQGTRTQGSFKCGDGTCLAFLWSSFVWFSWKRVFMGNTEPACYRQTFLVSVPHLAKEMNHYLFSLQPMQEMEIKHQRV